MLNFMLWLFNPRGRAPFIHLTGGWVSPRAGLNILEEEKNHHAMLELNP
jgi:hypothetical protein